MSETSTHTTALLNTLWEFNRGAEDEKDSFIQKALKVFKIFKVKPLKTPKLGVLAKKKTYNLFCKNMRDTNEELRAPPFLKQVLSYRRNGKS